MRVTESNVDELLVVMSDVKENIEIVEEAIDDWKSARDDGRDPDATREARESLDEALEQLDAASLCQLIHGKHRGK